MIKLRKLSINILLPSILMTVLIVLQGGVFLYEYQQSQNRLYIKSEQHLKGMAGELQTALSNALMRLEKAQAQEIISSISLDENIKTVAVIDNNHQIVLSNNFREKYMFAKLHLALYEGELLERAIIQNETIVIYCDESKELVVYAPLQMISKGNSLNRKFNAAIFMRYSLANDASELAHDSLLLLINFLLIILIGVGILVYFINRLVVLPIKQLTQTATVNDLTVHPLLPDSAVGEVGELQRSFVKFSNDISVNIDQIAASEQRWLYAVNAARDGVWDWDIEQDNFFYSTRWMEILGFPLGYLKNDVIEWEYRIHPDDFYTVIEDSAAHFNGKTPFFENTHRVKCFNGEYRWVLSRGQAVAWDDRGMPLRVIGTITDVSTYKKFSETIKYYNQYDEVSELPNRLNLTAHISQEIIRHKNNGLHGALVFIECHHDKMLSTLEGHNDKGKQLLYLIARRLESNKSASDFIAHLQGNGFVALLPDLHKQPVQAGELALNFARQLDLVLAAPFNISGEELILRCIYGVSLFPSDTLTADDLLRQTSIAVTNTPESPFDNISFFDKSIEEKIQRHHYLQNKLRDGINNHEFNLFFKPCVDINGNIIGAEIVSRWYTNDNGWINQGDISPIGEDSELINYLGDAVILNTFLNCKKLIEQGLPTNFTTFSIALNIKHLMSDNFINTLKSHLLVTDIKSSLIEFNLSALDIIKKTDVILDRLTLLHNLDFKLAIDGFGVGNDSISTLSSLPISTVTINDSLIGNLLKEQSKQVIVNAIVTVCESLNLTVCIKDVENKQQLDFLIAKGCKQFQGHYISAALSLDSFKSLLESENAKLNK